MIDLNNFNYECYLLDLDNTLLDINSAIEKGNFKISNILKEYNIDYDIFIEKFYKNQETLLYKLKNKELSEEDFRNKRYEDVLKLYIDDKAPEIAKKLNHVFTEETTKNIKLYEDAFNFLNDIKNAGKKIAVITNGNSKRQRLKIKHSGLENYVDGIFISDEIGFSKPHKNIFLKALEVMNVKVENCIMVGDSLKSDVLGAKSIGIDSILIDRFNNYVNYNGVIISSFDQLKI